MHMMIGGSNAGTELQKFESQRDRAQPISVSEYQQRLSKLRELMRESAVDCVYLDATSSLYYFTGLRCHRSERLHGALITGDALIYVCPAFEEEKTRAALLIESDFLLWQEHESPTALIVRSLEKRLAIDSRVLALDPETPFFIAQRLQTHAGDIKIVSAEGMIARCRQIKSSAELALLRQAKEITLTVQQAAARILNEGVDTREVQAFLDDAHRACGMDGASTFKIVLFGEATAYPHGVPYTQQLREGDMVLIDTGSTLHGYNSDITRSYVFGEPSQRQREIWEIESAAQAAAFAAAQIGAPCSAVDDAARGVIEAAGLGPDYAVPGLPHRTGHGVGLDVHECPYVVRGNDTRLAPGMCFSIEPMICSYGEFGVRLEDHAYMAEDGPRWFTEPSRSIDAPFELSN